MSSLPHADLRAALCATVHGFYQRGWALGTGGNFSILASADPFRLLITASGVDKGALTPAQILELDGARTLLSGTGAPSAETGLHYAILATLSHVRSVLHTHSPAATALTMLAPPGEPLQICGLEMLKGLEGVRTHEHTEIIPVLENSQDIEALAADVRTLLAARPALHAFLLRGHGLYTWGATHNEARRHVEILEFLFDVQLKLTNTSRTLQ